MELKINLIGNIIAKKNGRITVRATGRSFPSAKYTKWNKDCLEQIIAQNVIPPIPLEKIDEIYVKIYFESKRKADITNKNESVMDLLVDVGILLDDNYMVVPRLILEGEYRKNQGGCDIVITYPGDN